MATTATFSTLSRLWCCLLGITLAAACGHPTPKGDVRPSLVAPEGDKTPAAGAPGTSPSGEASTSDASKAPVVPPPASAPPPAAKVDADQPPTITTPALPPTDGKEPNTPGSADTRPGGASTDGILALSDAYAKKCAFCHGATGQGGTAGIRGPGLVKYEGEFSRYTAAIRNGVAGTTMGAYKAAKYSDADLAKDFTFFTKKPAL